MHELCRGKGVCSPEKFFKIGLSETPYPAFPGSNAINSYVYFVEIFSESRYSWFPSRSTKIHDSQVFKTKIHDHNSYMFCNYDSWFMIPLLPPIIGFVSPHAETGFWYRSWFTSLNCRRWKCIYLEFLRRTSAVNNYNNFCIFSTTVMNERMNSFN